VRDQTVADYSSTKLAGTTHDQRHSPAVISEVALHRWKRNAVVGGADHQRVFEQPSPLKRIDYLSDSLIHEARAGVMSCHVGACLWRVGDWDRRQDVVRIVDRRRFRILAMRLLKSNIEKKRFRRIVLDES